MYNYYFLSFYLFLLNIYNKLSFCVFIKEDDKLVKGTKQTETLKMGNIQ